MENPVIEQTSVVEARCNGSAIVGAQWLINAALVKTGLISIEATGDALRASRVAKENAAEASTLPAKTAGAAAAGISSFGGALAFGLLAVALIASLAGGFEEGGYTAPGGRSQPAGIVHAGEWVAPQWMVNDPVAGSMIDNLEAMRSGGITSLARPYQAPAGVLSDSGAGASQGVTVQSVHYFLIDPAEFYRAQQEHSTAHFHNLIESWGRKNGIA